MNSSDLKKKAAHRRRTTTSVWNCSFCNKDFVHEKVFLKHSCRQKERFEMIKTNQGRAAYEYYAEWFKAQRRKVPSIEAFQTSIYFNAFWNFVQYIIDSHIDRPLIYIKMMVSRDISPTLWSRDQTYCIYLEFCDRESPVVETIAANIIKLEAIADIAKINIKDIFTHLGFNQILEMIRSRNLSPWFLLNSKQFGKFYVELDNIEQKYIDAVIDYNYWVKVLNKDIKLKEEIQEVIELYGL